MDLTIESYSSLLNGLLQAAQAAGVYLIARLQKARSQSVQVRNGTVEAVRATFGGGVGMQVFTPNGQNAFASVDGYDEQRALDALAAAIRGARAAQAQGLQANRAVFTLSPLRTEVNLPVPYPFGHLALPDLQGILLGINEEARQSDGSPRVSTGWGIAEEAWRIVRSDGTDARFRLSRSRVGNSLTAQDGGTTVTTSAGISAPSYQVLLDDDLRRRLHSQTHRAAELGHRLLDAPHYAAGSYDLLIDYALAKGLAHEAFGHAAEIDGLRSSILGDAEGRFRVGERVAADHVSIVDEPIAGDHAYQPISPNGVRRQRTTILDHGVLREALADVFSAEAAGVPITGAGRCQSYRHVPVPRMTNIRIEVDRPVPVDLPFEEITPDVVWDLARDHGLLHSGRPLLYLSGYKGGQVNPVLGDFVFNCTGLYELTRDGVRLFKPAIFSGKTLEALKSIRAGFGPLQLDAIGTCGKAGQQVPSSGGSHFLLHLERNRYVTIGGVAQ